MKLAIGTLVFIWLLCGVVGAWWLGENDFHTIARGPISLARGYNESPPNYPGPN